MKCYLCKQEGPHLFLEKNSYQILKCPHCGLLFYDFKKDYSLFLEKQYSAGYFTGEKKLRSYFDYGLDRKNIIRNMGWYLEEIKKLKVKTKNESLKILDVGCAYGFFLEVAAKAGFDVYGIDPSAYAVSQAQKKFGERVKKGILETVRLAPASFDVVTLFDVFEHLKDPAAELQQIHRILKKDGLLVLATGDSGSFWAKLAGKKWTFYNPPQHIFYFNQVNVRRLLEENGFKVERITKTGKWLSLRYILHLGSTVGESRLAGILYGFVKDNFLGRLSLYLRLNDNMVVFAKK